MLTNGLLALAFIAVPAFAIPANAADPTVKCESGKLKEASKYGACRLKTEAKAVNKGAAANFSRCELKFADKWNKVESKAGPGVCPTEGDAVSIDDRITSDTDEIATLLAGGTVAPSGCVIPAVPVGTTPVATPAVCSDPPSPLEDAIAPAIAAAQAAADMTRAELLDPTVITVVTCGTGTPLPSDRAQACTAVFANGKFLLFDAGDGAQRSMENLDLPLDALTAVFLTHFHSDHIADVGEVMSRSWILGRTSTLPIYGSEPIERVVDGFNLIYGTDEVYRIAHHGEAIMPPDTLLAEAHEVIGADEDGVVVFSEDGVTVTAYGVDHSPVEPALGYRVDYAGKSVVISGDTIDTPGLQNASLGADVLVSEVMSYLLIETTECVLEDLGDTRNEGIFKDIRTYHIDVAALGAMAETAGVDTLVLTHMVPSLTGFLVDGFFTTPVSAAFSGTVLAAEDGDRVTIPLP